MMTREPVHTAVADCSGSGAPTYSGAQISNGMNPIWNQLGHERMGWAISVNNPATP